MLLVAAVGWTEPWPTLRCLPRDRDHRGSIGLVEDVRGIPTRRRAFLQAGVGLTGATAIVAVSGAPSIWILLGAVAIAVYINAANFMDGIDGMSGMHGVVVGAYTRTSASWSGRNG